MQIYKSLSKLFLIACFPLATTAQDISIPKVHSNIFRSKEGQLYYEKPDGTKCPMIESKSEYTLKQMRGGIKGTSKGIEFNFDQYTLEGKLYYGFIDHEDARHPLPVYFKEYAAIREGRAFIPVKEALSGEYDMVNWQESGQGTLGYRVTTKSGKMLYDGKFTFQYDDGFKVDTSVIEGPFVNKIQPDGAVISFQTNEPIKAKIVIEDRTFRAAQASKNHEIQVKNLKPNTKYVYQVICGDLTRSYELRTALREGSDEAFTFAYASDSRHGKGGGERHIHGVNAYIMKRIFAAASHHDARFMQFTGDLIDGYLNHPDEMKLQYANWKRAVEPYAHYLPFYASFGNHEALTTVFNDGSKYGVSVDRFPYDSGSAEKVFAEMFVNPENGPLSEDGASYDPEPGARNFPSYKENAFYYTYANVAIVSLNSDYWYSPSIQYNPEISGNLHGYIMDQQLSWLRETLSNLEQNQNIDHILVTQHTPAFPNGGHVDDDMWYDGNNKPRPYVNGEQVEKGIIERRDEYLDLVINQSDKVRAILTGDEHNYNKIKIAQDMPRYPDDYEHEKLTLERAVWQINNGAAGAPYYAKEKTPWMDHLRNFSTQNALVLFDVKGEKLSMRVVNPVTLETFDQLKLKE